MMVFVLGPIMTRIPATTSNPATKPATRSSIVPRLQFEAAGGIVH
jgi:hypothetical protein